MGYDIESNYSRDKQPYRYGGMDACSLGSREGGICPTPLPPGLAVATGKYRYLRAAPVREPGEELSVVKFNLPQGKLNSIKRTRKRKYEE